MPAGTAQFHYTDPDTTLEFVWHGGAYIDVGYTAQEPTGPFNDQGQPSHDAGDFVAHECINVWDYATDEPTIERTLDAFQERCRDWLSTSDDD